MSSMAKWIYPLSAVFGVITVLFLAPVPTNRSPLVWLFVFLIGSAFPLLVVYTISIQVRVSHFSLTVIGAVCALISVFFWNPLPADSVLVVGIAIFVIRVGLFWLFLYVVLSIWRFIKGKSKADFEKSENTDSDQSTQKAACPSCRKEIDQWNDFCVHCGVLLRSDTLNDENLPFVWNENLFVLFQDILNFGFAFMSWGAVFGLPLMDMAISGAIIGVLVWLLFRRINIYGVKMVSTIGGIGFTFALLGGIAWIVKAII